MSAVRNLYRLGSLAFGALLCAPAAFARGPAAPPVDTNHLVNGLPDWGWTPHDYANPSLVRPHSASVAGTIVAGWQGLQIHDTPFIQSSTNLGPWSTDSTNFLTGNTLDVTNPLVGPAPLLDGAGGPSLRERFDRLFMTGVALDGNLPADYNAGELRLITTQFAALTPVNCMKMTQLQPAEGHFDFRMADALVAFAATNRLKVCGHCLVWAKDERTPEWVFRDGERPASRELLLARLQQHIATVAGRYRGKVISWDVVNEALDDGTNFLRASTWFSTLGEEFVVKAFQFARQADPEALLVYNDYNVELPVKRAKLLRLLRLLRDRQVPIQAVGIQGHYELDAVPFQDIADTLAAIQSLGLKVMVTEFDLDAIPRARWWADGGTHRGELARFNPYPNGCPAAVLQRQAEQYRKLFSLFRQHSDAIARITFWDLHDGRSWLNHFPWERVNYPLLFDRNARPKPALGAVLSAP